MTAKQKSPIAQQMAKMRWQHVSAEDRTVYAKVAANARAAKYARERAEAIKRIPHGIRSRLSDLPDRKGSKYSFYYTIGYELGSVQHARATRKRMIREAQAYQRTLQREQRARDQQIELLKVGLQGLAHAKYWERRERLVLESRRSKRNAALLATTLAALKAPPLERLVLDRTRLATMKVESAATTSLRSILTDASVLALVPSSFRPALLDGLRAGALGEVMLIGFGTKERGRGAKLLS
jgi:hypothetical protein